MKLFKNQKGFTLIELLVVIGILAVLLAITLIAINPAKQFAQANNTQRSSDVNAILNAINQYMADNAGALPAGIPTGVYGTDDVEISEAGADLCTVLATEYLAALPVDPLTGASLEVADCAPLSAYVTGYNIVQSATNSRITVGAPDAELPGTVITVTR
jgi:prepilin-type N-terminal cleavage/methylation domain-containing protein